MKPYYQDDYVTIYNCRCEDILGELPKVDLVLTDPPYGMNLNTDFTCYKNKFKGKISGNKYDKITNDDKEIDLHEIINKGNDAVIFGADYFPTQLKNGTINVWDKKNETLDAQFGSCFELIWHKNKCKKKFYRYKWAGIFGMEHEPTKTRVHPTQKPERLIKIILEEYEAAKTILDPFAGSCTTGRAAKDLNRKCICIEISEAYCEIGAKRMCQEVMNFA